jgi:hypothetical protein
MIDFFTPIIERTEKFNPYLNIDWFDISNLILEYRQYNYIFLYAPDHLFESKEYLYLLLNEFSADLIYHYFSEEIKNDEQVIKDIFTTLVKKNKIHLLSETVKNNSDWMMLALLNKPHLYTFIGNRLKHDLDFNINFINSQPDRIDSFEFHLIPSIIFNSYEFLNSCDLLVQNNKLNISSIIKYLPLDFKQILLQNDVTKQKFIFSQLCLKLKLNSQISIKLIEHNLIKI